MDHKPDRAWLLLALLAMVALPVLGLFGVTSVGSYRMFSEPSEHRVQLWVTSSSGIVTPVPRSQIEPHLSKDALRVIHLGAGYRTGETHLELLQDGLWDLGRLSCEVFADSLEARVLLEQRSWFFGARTGANPYPGAVPVALTNLKTRFDTLFDGEVSAWPLAIVRIGIAGLILLRTSDWTRGVLSMDHHLWVSGIEYASFSQVAVPELESPLLVSLGPTVTSVLAVARIALAALLLIGIRPRITAALLCFMGYALMASDRYRYFHHLHLLWTSCGWLALAHSGERLSVESWFRNTRKTVARWPLQLLRFHLLVVYAAAGIAKLSGPWLDGRILERLHREGLIEPWYFDLIERSIGVSTASIGVAAAELLLVPLLVLRRTRLIGVALGFGIHVCMDLAMLISTFGLTMILLLTLFLPYCDRAANPSTEHVG